MKSEIKPGEKMYLLGFQKIDYKLANYASCIMKGIKLGDKTKLALKATFTVYTFTLKREGVKTNLGGKSGK